MKLFRCYEPKIEEESEKASSRQKSNPGHLWLEPLTWQRGPCRFSEMERRLCFGGLEFKEGKGKEGKGKEGKGGREKWRK